MIVGVVFAFILMFMAGPALAQDAALIDILQSKGVLSKKEAQQLKRGKGAQATYDQQALVRLLRAKGVLEEKDLAQ